MVRLSDVAELRRHKFKVPQKSLKYIDTGIVVGRNDYGVGPVYAVRGRHIVYDFFVEEFLDCYAKIEMHVDIFEDENGNCFAASIKD